MEELSREETWWTPNKLSQQTYDRNAQGEFAAYEEEVCLAVQVKSACHYTSCWCALLIFGRKKKK